MPCPLCQTSSQHLTHSHNREYHLCLECHLIFVPPHFFLPPDDEKSRYLEHENSLENEGYVRMFQEKIECVQEYCPDIQTVLDFGCGYEPVLKTLLERAGYRADGYDAFFFPDPPKAAAYDLIISTETFEHLKNPGEEISRIAGLLNPRGCLAVMTQFYPSPNGQPDAETFAAWYYHRDPTHICFYDPKTFEWIARHFNFDMIHNNGKDFAILRKTGTS